MNSSVHTGGDTARSNAELIKSLGIITRARWAAFKLLSAFSWLVCPEPMRSDLRAGWQGALAIMQVASDRERAKATAARQEQGE